MELIPEDQRDKSMYRIPWCSLKIVVMHMFLTRDYVDIGSDTWTGCCCEDDHAVQTADWRRSIYPSHNWYSNHYYKSLSEPNTCQFIELLILSLCMIFLSAEVFRYLALLILLNPSAAQVSMWRKFITKRLDSLCGMLAAHRRAFSFWDISSKGRMVW